MRSFRELRVWKDSHELTLEIYALTQKFPRDEIYGLTSQMRRSAASIPMNIAEGSVRSNAEFRHFLRVALGSAAEVDYQLILSRDLGYLTREAYDELEKRVNSIKKMLTVFIQRIGADPGSAQPLAYSLQPTAYGASEGAP